MINGHLIVEWALLNTQKQSGWATRMLHISEIYTIQTGLVYTQFVLTLKV